MTQKIKISDLKTFDMAEMLDSEQTIADYLTLVLEENDPAALAQALGTVARARGMTSVAQSAGIAREALYKALRPGSQPRFETIQRVMTALGVKLTVSAAGVTSEHHAGAD
jgi:probable addiction module antidote protein